MINKSLLRDSICSPNQTETVSGDLVEITSACISQIGTVDAHSERVAAYAVAVGRELDLPEEALRMLHSAAMLHDIGKVGISSSIVNKLGRLSASEFEIMRLHSTIAVKMLSQVEALKGALPMIKHHHERFDGKGYPDRLKKHEIPLGARIISVAETFDILVSGAPWKAAITIDEAVLELQACSGTQFDPMVVDALVNALQSKGMRIPETDDEEEEMPPQPPRRILQ